MRKSEKLRSEKMILSMDKVPLEARFRQKEDAWSKDQYRLVQEIEPKIAAEDERHRDSSSSTTRPGGQAATPRNHEGV
jgi:hypothetical protein